LREHALVGAFSAEAARPLDYTAAIGQRIYCLARVTV
jgi:hypothetical protein